VLQTVASVRLRYPSSFRFKVTSHSLCGASIFCCESEGLDPNSPAFRAQLAQELADVAAIRRSKLSELDWREIEQEALYAASISLESCWDGKGECPEALMSKFQRPLTFFGTLRNPSEDPPPEALDSVRARWPALAGRDNEAILAALQPIKDMKVDMRSIR